VPRDRSGQGIALVEDLQQDLGAAPEDLDPDPAARRVTDGVGQGLLDDAVDRSGGSGPQFDVGGPQLHWSPRRPDPLDHLRQVGECGRETGTAPDAVFGGIATSADARAYLDGVQRTVVDGLGFDAPATYSDQLPGGKPSGPPADQDFWIAQATGHGTQEVTWDPAGGHWMFVVMNADGSQRVDVEARIGAEAPALVWIGWGALALGSVLTVVAVRLLVRGFRPTWDQAPSLQYRQPQGNWSPRRSSPVAGAGTEPGSEPGGVSVEEHPCPTRPVATRRRPGPI
jgi:hypothetical protein